MEHDNAVSRFPFPFKPYPIQERFMAELYDALEQGKVGVFESPTGTVSPHGSLICLNKTVRVSLCLCDL